MTFHNYSSFTNIHQGYKNTAGQGHTQHQNAIVSWVDPGTWVIFYT